MCGESPILNSALEKGQRDVYESKFLCLIAMAEDVGLSCKESCHDLVGPLLGRYRQQTVEIWMAVYRKYVSGRIRAASCPTIPDRSAHVLVESA
jgi:hypothetical protein